VLAQIEQSRHANEKIKPSQILLMVAVAAIQANSITGPFRIGRLTVKL
jgi:hypothetical protein